MIAWLTGKVAYVSTWLGFQLGCGFAQRFPRAAFWLVDQAAKIAYRFFGRFRVRSVRNIQAAFIGVDRGTAENTARRSLRNFFRASVEASIAVNSSDDELRRAIPITGLPHLAAAVSKGNGVVILSAHLGNFFLVGARLTIEGYDAAVLINQPRDGRFAELMDDYRLRTRQRTIHARPRREALRELNELLRRNGVAVMIADEYRKSQGIEVSFFGLKVKARRGPVTLALRTGAAVVPACMVRQPDDTLRLVIEPELELMRSGKSKEEIYENTLLITRWLESAVEKYPDQWNWMNLHWAVPNDSAAHKTAVKELAWDRKGESGAN